MLCTEEHKKGASGLPSQIRGYTKILLAPASVASRLGSSPTSPRAVQLPEAVAFVHLCMFWLPGTYVNPSNIASLQGVFPAPVNSPVPTVSPVLQDAAAGASASQTKTLDVSAPALVGVNVYTLELVAYRPVSKDRPLKLYAVQLPTVAPDRLHTTMPGIAVRLKGT